MAEVTPEGETSEDDGTLCNSQIESIGTEPPVTWSQESAEVPYIPDLPIGLSFLLICYSC